MPTSFESKVHAVVREVPAGKVTTYGAVAAVAGGCARSVGAVMRKNCPAETLVPWQRVIASDRRLGGFSGEWGAAAPAVQRKRALLESEGVVFDADGRVSAACVLRELPARDDAAAPPAKRSRKAPTQAEIATETLRILEAREAGKTCWPSEAPRRLAGNASDWRSWMPASHAAVRDLVGRGRVVVTQKGSVVDVKTVRGPYRVRLVSSWIYDGARAYFGARAWC